MGGLEERLARRAKELKEQEAQKSQETETQSAEKEVENLTASIKTVGEIIDSLASFRDERLALVSSAREKRQVLNDLDKNLQELLQNSAFQAVLAEANITNVQELVSHADYSDAPEVLEQVDAQEKLARSHTDIRAQAPQGLAAIRRAKEYLQEPKFIGGFDDLITALDAKKVGFEKELEVVIPKTAEGRKVEQAKQGLRAGAERFWKQQQGRRPLSEKGNMYDPVTEELLASERVLGRQKANEGYLSELANAVAKGGERELAKEEKLPVGLAEIQKQFKFFEELKGKTKELYEMGSSLQEFATAIRYGTSEAYHDNKEARDLYEKAGHDFRGGEDNSPPFYHYELNRVVNGIAKNAGLVAYDQLVMSPRMPDNYKQQSLVDQFGTASRYLSGTENASPRELFPRRSSGSSYEREKPQESNIPDPDYVKNQLDSWKSILEAVSNRLGNDAETLKRFFSENPSERKQAIVSVLPQEMRESIEEGSEAKVRHLEFPINVYDALSQNNPRELRSKLERISKQSREQAETIVKAVKERLDLSWTKRDIESLEKGPEGKTLLSAKQSLVNKAGAERLIGHGRTVRGEMEKLETAFLERSHRAEVLLTSERSRGRQFIFKDLDANQTISNEQASIQQYTQKHQSLDVLGNQIRDKQAEIFKIQGSVFKRGLEIAEQQLAELNRVRTAWERGRSHLDSAQKQAQEVNNLQNMLDRAAVEGLLFPETMVLHIQASRTVGELVDRVMMSLATVRDAKTSPDQAAALEKYQTLATRVAELERSIQGGW